MLLSSPPVERCRPLLGTFVRIRVHGLPTAQAHLAIEAAFEEILCIQRLMSFRDAHSDIVRLNHEACFGAVKVDVRTREVLRRAAVLSELSDGLFDVSVAPELVMRGCLPLPENAPEPDIEASWRDLVFSEEDAISYRKPLWIDLGGIAKGYAVDCAVDVLRTFSPIKASVNAGGDIRVLGCERIELVPDGYEGEITAVADIKDGSLASSCGRMIGKLAGDSRNLPHVNARNRHVPDVSRFVSVMAPYCVDADALTKVVMAMGMESAPILKHYSAKAFTYTPLQGWTEIQASL